MSHIAFLGVFLVLFFIRRFCNPGVTFKVFISSAFNNALKCLPPKKKSLAACSTSGVFPIGFTIGRAPFSSVAKYTSDQAKKTKTTP